MANKETIDSDVLSTYVLGLYRDFSTFRKDKENDMHLNIDQWEGRFTVKWKGGEGSDWRSKIFVNMTKRKCRSAQAILRTTLFPGSKIPMKIEPTPVMEGPWAQILDKDELEARAEKQEQVYKDWATEGDIESEFDKLSFDLIVHGSGAWRSKKFKTSKLETWLPVEETFVKSEDGTIDMENLRYEKTCIEKQIPTGEHIDIWDVFMDPEGNDAQDGVGVIHRPSIRPDELLQMAKDDPTNSYDMEAVKEVVKNSSKKNSSTGSNEENPNKDKNATRRETITLYDFWGKCSVQKLLAYDEEVFGELIADLFDEEDDDVSTVEVNIVIADSKTISVKINICGKRPINVVTWLKQNGTPYGIGVPECMRDMQEAQNGTARAYMDAKKFDGVPIGAVKRSLLADGETPDIYPGKMFELLDEVENLSQIIQFTTVPSGSQNLIDGLQWSSKEADDDSGIPKLLEGEMADVEKTRYEVEQSMSGSHAFILYIMKKIDRHILAPQWYEYYDYLMRSEEYIEIYADMSVKAYGYETYSRRVKLANSLMFMLQSINNMNNPEVNMETNFKAILKDLYESQNLDGFKYTFSKEEVEQKQRQMMQMQAEEQMKAQQQMQMQEQQKQLQKEVSNLPPEMQEAVIAGKEQGLIQ